ncbi:DMT family transporter [Bacillus hominis]|uniref:DMT family transporter n=1 Tax=Bacillus hominis TaxID=2817478 RepID=UPI001BB35AB1|nr:DMT family transporter [Bacillus hominis]
MTRTYILLFICVVVWGSNFIFGAILVNAFHPVLLTTLRLLFINLFFLAYAIICKKDLYIEKNEMKSVLLIGVMGVAINQWSFYEGLQTAEPTTAALILALTPVVTSILAVFILNEPLTAKLVIGGGIATFGVFFVIGVGQRFVFSEGLIWIFITMLSFSLSIVLIRKLGKRDDMFFITFFSSIFGFLIMLPFLAFTFSHITLKYSIESWSLLIVTAILMHGICTLVWNNQLRKAQASTAAMFLNLEPFVTMVVGYIILQKGVTSIQIIGAIFIVCGVYIATFGYGKKSKGQKELFRKAT